MAKRTFEPYFNIVIRNLTSPSDGGNLVSEVSLSRIRYFIKSLSLAIYWSWHN